MTLTDYGLIVSIIVGSVSTILSIIALNISHKTFQQQKTFENENHLYEYKFNNYITIINKLTDFALTLETKAYDIYDRYTNKEITEEEVYDFTDEVDRMIDTLQKETALLATFIPVPIVKQVDRVLDVVYKIVIDDILTEKELKKVQSVTTIMALRIDKLNRLMVLDLGLNNIHKRLIHRTRDIKKR